MRETHKEHTTNVVISLVYETSEGKILRRLLLLVYFRQIFSLKKSFATASLCDDDKVYDGIKFFQWLMALSVRAKDEQRRALILFSGTLSERKECSRENGIFGVKRMLKHKTKQFLDESIKELLFLLLRGRNGKGKWRIEHLVLKNPSKNYFNYRLNLV